MCAAHFLQHLKESPFKGSTRKDFMEYVCRVHNMVNKELGKEEYECRGIEKEWEVCVDCNSRND